MRLLVIFAVSALTGCAASLPKIQAKEPTATYVSGRSVPSLTECLATSVSYIATPSVIPGEQRTVISFAYGPRTDVVITLRSEGGSTAIEIRTDLPYKARFRRAVEGCLTAT